MPSKHEGAEECPSGIPLGLNPRRLRDAGGPSERHVVSLQVPRSLDPRCHAWANEPRANPASRPGLERVSRAERLIQMLSGHSPGAKGPAALPSAGKVALDSQPHPPPPIHLPRIFWPWVAKAARGMLPVGYPREMAVRNAPDDPRKSPGGHQESARANNRVCPRLQVAPSKLA